MSAHPPPVPPDQRSDKGPGKQDGTVETTHETEPRRGFKSQDRNLAEQGRQGATKQNTTNKGFQQDR